ncbi:helix-turn-helix domain-containing protein [Rhodanobacter sp. KK11]|jgi:HTH-type transcriptional regulator/antitoxin HipB|uniref:helix-turn-helix domain-containing protein n=1 Tax=Rhodanobacter sp. KK11 TaxID=3083255 RepID=UPI00296645E7|nr:helix-turn-helix domain-containing protein [Rhodanobacter sp. KK11]MDW2982849.1 helix-turn-helix domain-containing protein [Rhodanobacter sp. KK11]
MHDLARTPKQTGTHIRRQRKRLGLSQRELGDRAGLRQETISLIENGNAATRLDTLLMVLAALDLELQIAPRNRDDDIGALIG